MSAMTTEPTSEPLALTESIAHSISAHGPTCIGCRRHGAFAMLSYFTSPKTEGTVQPVHDLFLTREQASILRNQLDHLLTSTHA